MTVVRKALGWVAELALEYFVAGLATAAGEAVVTESIKAAKRRAKRKRKAAEKETPPTGG
jgi:hypothetical protein